MTEKQIKAKIKASGVAYELGPIFDCIADPSKITEEMKEEVIFAIFEYLKKEGLWESLGIKSDCK